MVFPYINMHPPLAYTCSPFWNPLSPPSPYHPSGSSQCTSPKLPVSCIEPGLAIRFLYDIVHVLMPFSQIILPLPKIAFQCSVGFCCTIMQISHNYTHIISLLSLPTRPQPHPSRWSHSARLGFLCYIATSNQLPVLHMLLYICWCCFLHLSHSFLLPLCLQLCSLYLHLHSFSANRFINTIFLDSIWMQT